MLRVLTINPGSTSTKIGLFDDDQTVFEETIRHSDEDLLKFERVADQFDFRKEMVLNCLKDKGIEIETLDGCVGRGGLLKPIHGGVWNITDAMVKDLHDPPMGEHASNLGALIARAIAESAGGIPSFIVDPVVVDEMDDIARYSGHPYFKRLSIFHALNQKASARKAAEKIGKAYSDINCIVAHLGGGISVGAHKKGRVVDVNNALNGEGPFSPERSGTLPAGHLVKVCYSGFHSESEVNHMLKGMGGFRAYLNTADMREVKKMIADGNEEAAAVFKAMAYQVSKEIGSLAAVLEGQVDCIVLTGGLAYNEDFTSLIEKRVSFAGPVVIFPGEEELPALRDGALRVLKGEETASDYE
jgi:butyrate kinase